MPRGKKLSFQMIKQILIFAATLGKDNYIAIQTSLDNLPIEESTMESTPDTRTIRRVIETDLPNMSREVVLEHLPPSVWYLRKDYEEITKLAAGSMVTPESTIEKKPDISETPSDESITFDKNTFKAADAIMGEEGLTIFLGDLEVHRIFQWSNYCKVGDFQIFISLEGNKHINPELRELQDHLSTVLIELLVFVKLEFTKDAKLTRNDWEYRLDPSGLRYIKDEKEKTELIDKTTEKLDESIKVVRTSYKAYRAGIRERLYI